MIYVLYSIHVIVCLFLILVVLLQQGKGADLSVFGGGTTQAAFGARGAATLLHKMTVGSFVAFILTTTGIGFLQTGGSQSSVMSTMSEEAPVVEESAAEEMAVEEAAPAETPAESSATEEEIAVPEESSGADETPADSAADTGGPDS
ncbi:MAG: preprotein translocase subunit SecG [Acidobacteriota bacterium]